MKIQLNVEQVKLKKELREYFSEMMTPALIEECERDLGEGGGPLWRKALKQMGRDGCKFFAPAHQNS